MPIMSAFPLGLVLSGTTTTVLADGSQSFKLTALGKVTLGTQTEVGLVLLNTGSSDILVGMDFLRQFKKVLMVSEKRVVLADEQDLQQKIQEAQAAIQDATNPSPPEPSATPPSATPPATHD